VDSTVLVLLGESNELIRLGGGGAWEHSSADLVVGGGSLEDLSGGVVDQALLWLAILAWEEDKLRLVGVQSFGVELHLIGASVGSAVINGNANSAGELGGETSGLKLIESESTTVADLSSVPAGAGRHDWTQLLDWPWEHGLALGVSALSSSQLSGGLVEVSFCSALPVLAEMYVWDDVIVLDHC